MSLFFKTAKSFCFERSFFTFSDPTPLTQDSENAQDIKIAQIELSKFLFSSCFKFDALSRLFFNSILDKCIVSNPVSSVPLKQYTNGVNIQCKMRPRSVVRLGLSKKKHARRLHPYWNASQIRSDGQVVPDVDVSDE